MVRPDILRAEAQQFSIDRPVNQVKADPCDAIECRFQNLVA